MFIQELEFNSAEVGAPAIPDPLPDCGAWTLALLGEVFSRMDHRPVITFYSGDWERQTWWHGERFKGRVGELFMQQMQAANANS